MHARRRSGALTGEVVWQERHPAHANRVVCSVHALAAAVAFLCGRTARGGEVHLGQSAQHLVNQNMFYDASRSGLWHTPTATFITGLGAELAGTSVCICGPCACALCRHEGGAAAYALQATKITSHVGNNSVAKKKEGEMAQSGAKGVSGERCAQQAIQRSHAHVRRMCRSSPPQSHTLASVAEREGWCCPKERTGKGTLLIRTRTTHTKYVCVRSACEHTTRSGVRPAGQHKQRKLKSRIDVRAAHRWPSMARGEGEG
jgi:hypothetical protein